MQDGVGRLSGLGAGKNARSSLWKTKGITPGGGVFLSVRCWPGTKQSQTGHRGLETVTEKVRPKCCPARANRCALSSTNRHFIMSTHVTPAGTA